MKTLLLTALALAGLNFTIHPEARAQAKAKMENYRILTDKTQVHYIGKKVTGQHDGHVKVKEGSLSLSGDLITKGVVVVDMNSMTVEDIKDEETAKKYLGHMKSADFFDTQKYPEARLVINNSKKVSGGLEITGNLTILNETHPISFVATDVKKTGENYSAKANLEIDRTKFGLKYGSGSFFKGLGDKAIHDKFTLNIDLFAKKI